MDSIANATQHFQQLLEEQMQRAERLEQAPVFDFHSRPLNIGLIGGDGIGPAIVDSAEQVLRHMLAEELRTGELCLRQIQGLTIENRMACGQSIPDAVMAEIRECPVLLKGPTTTPNGGTMESANVAMRRALDLFANVRPVRIAEQGIDWTFFRENTEGEYTLGSRGLQMDDLLAVDFKVITVSGTRRIARAAFEFARSAGKTHVSIVTKANIMKKTDGLFSRICHEVAAEYPEIQTDEYYVDIMSANLVNPVKQQKLQWILCPNLYGDILTDEAAQLQGGVGTAGSANIGGAYAMFEAIHGSAPRIVEEGRLAWANPESILQASAMLLDHIGLHGKAEALKAAMDQLRAQGTTVKTGGITTREYTEALMALL